MQKAELQQIIREELEAVIDEKRKRRKKRKKRKAKKKKAKRDACYYKVKARYSVWPSAYASGALVRCRRVGAKNWGNKSKKKNEGLEINEEKHDFKPHMMYCPRSGKSEMAKTKEDHLRLKKKGFVHVDPDDLRDVLKDEGGASGMDPFIKATDADEKEIKQALKMMPDVGQHEDKDYILDDDKQIKVVKKKKSVKESIIKVLTEKKSLKNGQSRKEASEQKVAPTQKASP